MATHPLYPRVRTIIAAIRPTVTHDIVAESELRRDLGWDCIDRTTLACDIEEAFGVQISDADLERFQTVRDVVEAIAAMAGEIAA